MALLNKTKKSAGNLISVIGIESSPESFIEPAQDNYSRTAECAYYKAEARGFEPGHEVEIG
ncbi:MAG: hypothetical protein A3I83_05765 [Methylotenera sp. RIFCSPLOWO2_02_FULL_45_14]|nr:MAG: hypothetical protein A3I83_05765 [Methylotenera sp. RIFCSPLOWO2_02_FULL_45_14]